MDIEYRHFKIFILSILALLLAAFIGFVYFSAKESVQTFGGTPVIVGGTAVAAEVVSSPFLRARGLSSPPPRALPMRRFHSTLHRFRWIRCLKFPRGLCNGTIFSRGIQ